MKRKRRTSIKSRAFGGNFIGIKKADEAMDLLCYHNYIAGRFDENIPVDENREIFAEIKRLLAEE